MEHDDGFSFGIGAFETMSVVKGRCVMARDHISRLTSALEDLGIARRISEQDIAEVVSDGHLDGMVLKVEVSERNTIFSDRPNPYDDARHSRGFDLCVSDVRRNETSPFTFMKTLQYGDSITEKRKAMSNGFDESLFLNSRGEICEGATTNIFFTDGDRIVTPPIACGLLPGTLRAYVVRNFDVTETVLRMDDLDRFDGCFVTNSLMGAMPVNSIGSICFGSRAVAETVQRTYVKDVDAGL